MKSFTECPFGYDCTKVYRTATYRTRASHELTNASEFSCITYRVRISGTTAAPIPCARENLSPRLYAKGVTLHLPPETASRRAWKRFLQLFFIYLQKNIVNMSDSDMTLSDDVDVGIILMTLRKPTEIKKVIDTIPKPDRAVPKNGLPLWYKLGLESKLPVPKMPKGKIVFSRGRIGEDVRRLGLGRDEPNPSFDLTDPYCYNVSYDYVPMHDPHLASHFAQKPARTRMKILGYCTKDNRAVCSLKEFNQYRKYLYNQAKEQEKKIQARMKYLAEFNEKQRKERAARAREKQNRIKQRVQAAAEIELRRKITMVRLWRANEKKRLNRLRQEREAKQKRLEDEKYTGKETGPRESRWGRHVITELAEKFVKGGAGGAGHGRGAGGASGVGIAFGGIEEHENEIPAEGDYKSIKDRPPTPVPSKLELAEVTFTDRLDDLPDPVAIGSDLPERAKLLEMINAAAKLLSRTVTEGVSKGMDIITGKVTLPSMRQP
ncbi:unnamed protein product, partial [Leptidea sinapis]